MGLLLFHNNQLVGMIDSEPTDIEFDKTDSKAIGMGDVFIKSNYRGRGLGAALLAFANNRIRESGIDLQINPEMLGIIKEI